MHRSDTNRRGATVAIGFMLIRIDARPRWAGWVLIVAGVLVPASRVPGIEALALVADALFVVALLPLGLALLRIPART